MTDRMLPGILCLLLFFPGCRLAGSSLSMNSDTGVPFLGMSLAPKQSEPEMEFARRKTPLPPPAAASEKSSSGNFLTRWTNDDKKGDAEQSKKDRIELPRTDIDDDEYGEQYAETGETEDISEGDAFEF